MCVKLKRNILGRNSKAGINAGNLKLMCGADDNQPKSDLLLIPYNTQFAKVNCNLDILLSGQVAPWITCVFTSVL